MKSDNILAALNDIDPELIEDAEGQHKPSRTVVFLKGGTVAAVVCLAFFVVLAYIFITDSIQLGNRVPPIYPTPPRPSATIPSPTLPLYEGIVYTAEEIAGFFGSYQGGTASYKEVCVPSPEYLQWRNTLDSPYWTLYQYNIPPLQINQTEFLNFFDPKLTGTANALGIATPPYTVHETSIAYTDRDLEILITDADGYWFSAHHNAVFSTMLIANSADTGIRLGDVQIEVDQTKSDDEIIASLSAIKETLFDLFGVSFSDITIKRHYYADSEHGAEWLYVYFYNKTDHPLNQIADTPYSDCITLEFDNALNYTDDIISDTILRNVTIRYLQYRLDPKAIYLRTKQVPIISLQEAEALLYKGYVFGGYSCPICIAEQAAVDFADYDFVEIVYLRTSKSYRGSASMIPFYTFYKKIGTAKNGCEVYAQTYVPAVQVSGYEEYFEAEHGHENE